MSTHSPHLDLYLHQYLNDTGVLILGRFRKSRFDEYNHTL